MNATTHRGLIVLGTLLVAAVAGFGATVIAVSSLPDSPGPATTVTTPGTGSGRPATTDAPMPLSHPSASDTAESAPAIPAPSLLGTPVPQVTLPQNPDQAQSDDLGPPGESVPRWKWPGPTRDPRHLDLPAVPPISPQKTAPR